MGHSILQFGSYIRGTSDKYSDKDILLVSDNYNELKSLNKKYSRLGWSVSSYTYKKLEFLSNNGYLFVKHLIDEGTIIKDSNNLLKTILQSFNENKNYEKEIIEANHFLDFIETIPNNTISYMWLCDNIYITLRNILIYQSAVNKEYIFSYPKLVKNLLDKNIIDSKECKILTDLRILKASYRSSFKDITPSKKYIDQLLLITSRLGIVTKFNFTDKEIDLSNNVLNTIKTPYKKLRYLELFLVNNNIDNPYIYKCVTNPQMYSNMYSIKKILKIINKTKCQLKKKQIIKNEF